jgi:7,8-dihydropterin-6-yl-methyl-4-(beta-D-ribofuranosyl)aminobenzene 5'-phosphate synthase
MKLTVLVDNNTFIDRYFTGEPGLSFLIEDAGKKILFDVGYSGAFLENAAKMGMSLLDVDYIILSHGHFDHTWGLVPLIKRYTEAAIEKIACKRPLIITHPKTFQSKTFKNVKEIGSLISEEKLNRHFDIKLSKEPFQLTGNLVFLGEIERKNSFEARKSLGKVFTGPEQEEDDYLTEDSALIYKSSQGLVVITGCSHSGICNIVEYGKKVCNDERIVDIIGGFHLLDPSEELLQGTLDYLKRSNPRQVHACHCTDLNSKIALAGVVCLKEVGVGLRLEYE